MASSSRVHVVLVPGFAGFDALGQLEYYAGVTPLLRAWQRRNREPRLVLHYFDNFPTAGVSLRAKRLAAYLCKRVLRGEVQPGDDVVLVGHSTGGLDIRRLLLDLAGDTGPVLVDGIADPARTITGVEMLRSIRRVVFLSVPQRGTNIADWVAARPIERKAAIAQLRAAVSSSSDLPLIGRLEAAIAGSTAALWGAELFCAVEDALSEVAREHDPHPDEAAASREAAAQLGLWLQHMAHDGSAIDDLTAEPRPGSESPAHATDGERECERQLWDEWHIATRSFATLAPRVTEFPAGRSVPPWNPVLDPVCRPVEGTDFVYRAAWRACAGGPAAYSGNDLPDATRHGSAELQRIEPWDSDGIVNTASMLWPDGADTRLVHADHMDVVGHFELAPAPHGGPRRYRAYDLLGSGSRFDHDAFERLWTEVFEFCADVTMNATVGRQRART